jgi:hypothetical protein
MKMVVCFILNNNNRQALNQEAHQMGAHDTEWATLALVVEW